MNQKSKINQLHQSVKKLLARVDNLHQYYLCLCDPIGGEAEKIITTKISLFDDTFDMTNRLCQVDGALIHKEHKKVKLIIDIIEQDHSPIMILGNFFTAAFSNKLTFERNNRKEKAVFSDAAIFVQLVNLTNGKSSEENKQLQQLSLYVNQLLQQKKNSHIQSYYLFSSDDGIEIKSLESLLKSIVI